MRPFILNNMNEEDFEIYSVIIVAVVSVLLLNYFIFVWKIKTENYVNPLHHCVQYTPPGYYSLMPYVYLSNNINEARLLAGANQIEYRDTSYCIEDEYLPTDNGWNEL